MSKRITPDIIEQVIEMYANNRQMPVRVVAQHFGMAESTASRYIKAAGVMRPRNAYSTRKGALNDEQVDEVCRLYVEEMKTARELAEMFFCGQDTILKHLRKRGLTRSYQEYGHRPQPQKHALTPEQVEQATYWYVELGMTSGDIAKVFFCHPTTVRGYLRKSGVKLRPKGGGKPRVPQSEYIKIRYLYEECRLSTNEIGELLGLHPTAISSRMDRAGLKRRTPSEALKIAYERGRKQVTGLTPGGVNRRSSSSDLPESSSTMPQAA